MLECPMAPLCDFRSTNEGEIDEHVVTCDVVRDVETENAAIRALGLARGDI
jgi:hypothetical protein